MDNYRNIFDNKFINIKKDLYNYIDNKNSEYIIKDCAKKICETAIKLWKVKNPTGIADATVFVLFFK